MDPKSKKCPLCGADIWSGDDRQAYCDNSQSLDTIKEEIEKYLNLTYEYDHNDLQSYISELKNRLLNGVFECNYEEIYCKNDGKAIAIIGDKDIELPKEDYIYCPYHDDIEMIPIDNEITNNLDTYLKTKIPDKQWIIYYHPTWEEENKINTEIYKYKVIWLSEGDKIKWNDYLTDTVRRLSANKKPGS
jgi:hypothetical protein